MTRPEALVQKIRGIEARTEAARLDFVAARAAAIAELYDLVGPGEAARLLGVSPAAIYKGVNRSKGRKP